MVYNTVGFRDPFGKSVGVSRIEGPPNTIQDVLRIAKHHAAVNHLVFINHECSECVHIFRRPPSQLASHNPYGPGLAIHGRAFRVMRIG